MSNLERQGQSQQTGCILSRHFGAGSHMRINSIDRLKFSAAITIVFLHSYLLMDVSPWLGHVTGGGFFRLAVPVFAIISGWFYARHDLAGRRDGWVRHVLLIFLGLMAVYAPFWWPQVKSARDLLVYVLNGFYHLWYLPGIALAAIVTRYTVKYPWFPWLVAGCAGIGLALQYTDFLRGGIQQEYYRNGLFFLFPFFAIGYHFSARLPDPPLWLVAGALVSVGVESSIWYLMPKAVLLGEFLLSIYLAAPLLFATVIRRAQEADCAPHAIYRTSDFLYFFHIIPLLLLQKAGVGNSVVLGLVTLGVTLAGALVWQGARRMAIGRMAR